MRDNARLSHAVATYPQPVAFACRQLSVLYRGRIGSMSSGEKHIGA